MSATGRPGAKRVPESATDRLSRLLTMVPWLVNRQGIDIAEAAAGLGVTEKQLEDDLQLLFMCGYGQMPDELIDAQWEGGRVFVTNADTIARPLRLGVDEALTLMVGLRALAAVPGIGERAAIERALAKLEEATGASAAAAARVDVAIDEGGGGAVPRGRPPRAGAAAPAPPALPGAEPRRGHRARRRPHAGGQPRRPLVPRGLVPPRPGHPAVPDGPDRAPRGARPRRHAAAPGAAARPRRRHLHRPRPKTCWSPCGSSPEPPG